MDPKGAHKTGEGVLVDRARKGLVTAQTKVDARLVATVVGLNKVDAQAANAKVVEIVVPQGDADRAVPRDEMYGDLPNHCLVDWRIFLHAEHPSSNKWARGNQGQRIRAPNRQPRPPAHLRVTSQM